MVQCSYPRCPILATLVSLTFLVWGTLCLAHDNTPPITFSDGKLSVFIVDGDFRDVMNEIGRISGIQVVFVGAATHFPLTDSFQDLPLKEGLLHLLRDRNYVFTYARGGTEPQLEKMFLLAGQNGSVANSMLIEDVLDAALGAEAETVELNEELQELLFHQMDSFLERLPRNLEGGTEQFLELLDQLEWQQDGGRQRVKALINQLELLSNDQHEQ